MKINLDFKFDQFLSLLQVAFIVLKLIGQITWSWVWVLAPLWGSAIFICLVMLIGWIKIRK